MFSILASLVLNIVLGILIGTCIVFFSSKFGRKKIKCCDDGWQPIDTFPHEENGSSYRGEEFIFTDGKNVKSTWIPIYDKDGDIVIGLLQNKATHWRYLPLPPFSEIKE